MLLPVNVAQRQDVLPLVVRSEARNMRTMGRGLGGKNVTEARGVKSGSCNGARRNPGISAHCRPKERCRRIAHHLEF